MAALLGGGIGKVARCQRCAMMRTRDPGEEMLSGGAKCFGVKIGHLVIAINIKTWFSHASNSF